LERRSRCPSSPLFRLSVRRCHPLDWNRKNSRRTSPTRPHTMDAPERCLAGPSQPPRPAGVSRSRRLLSWQPSTTERAGPNEVHRPAATATAETPRWVREPTRRTKSIQLCISTPGSTARQTDYPRPHRAGAVRGMTSFIPLEGATFDIRARTPPPPPRRTPVAFINEASERRPPPASRARDRASRTHVVKPKLQRWPGGGRARHFRCRTMIDARRRGDNQFPATP